MSIDDLVPKILVERYDNHSRSIIRSLVYRMRQWNVSKRKFAVGDSEIRLIYYAILKKFPSIKNHLQKLVEKYKKGDVTPRIDKIPFHDIYESNGKPRTTYPKLTFRLEEEVRKIISLLAKKGVMEVVDYGSGINYEINSRVYMMYVSNKL